MRGTLRDIIFKGQTANYLVLPRTVRRSSSAARRATSICSRRGGDGALARSRGAWLSRHARWQRDSWIRLTMAARRRNRFLLAGPGSLFIVIALLLPLLSIVVFSFWRTESYELYADWNLDNYRSLLGEAAYRFFLRSLRRRPLVVAHLPACLAWPVAYFIARLWRPLPPAAGAAAGGAVLHRRHPAGHRTAGLFGPVGLINMALGDFGIRPIAALMYTPVRRRCRAGLSLRAVHGDGDLSVAGELQLRTAGGGQDQRRQPWRAFVEITWPLNWIGTAIGLVLVFIPCLASAVTQRFLGGPQATSLRHEPGAAVRRDRHLGARLGDGRRSCSSPRWW